MKRILCCLLAMLLLMPCAFAEDASYESVGYASPEEAVTAYAAAFAEGDVMGMISTFAVETYVDCFDSQKYIEHMRIYNWNDNDAVLNLPTVNEYNRQLRVLSRVSSILRGFNSQYIALCGVTAAQTDIKRGYGAVTFEKDDAEAISGFLELVTNTAWPGSVAAGPVWDSGVAKAYDWGKGYDRQLESQRGYLCCDELADVGVALEIDGKSYLQVMQCVRYGDRWYNLTAHGYLAILLETRLQYSSSNILYGLLPMEDVLSFMGN